MNCTDYKTDEYLPVSTCQVMDLEEHTACSEQDPDVCIICPILGRFLTGESLHDVAGTGHIVCLLLWSMVVVIGVLGVFNNLLIIIVTKRMNTGRPFDILIMFLAVFDMLCSGTALIGTTAHVALYQSWVERGYFAMHWFHNFNQATLLFRTTSTYMSMLITLERFLVICFPFKMKPWFTSRKTTLLAIGVTLISLLLNIPRFLTFEVDPVDDKHSNITALADFKYIIGVTHTFGWNSLCLFHEKFGNINEHLDFLAPLPILLVFNILSYMKVQKIQKERGQLNAGQKADVEALKLFLPVVVAYFSTNIVPFVQFGNAISTGTFYRELNIAVGLSIVINSAINFHIYYYQRPAFKTETKIVLAEWLKFLSVCQKAGNNRHLQVNNIDIGNGSCTTGL